MISSYSAWSWSCIRPVNWRKRISTIARDCISVRLKRSIKPAIASFGVLAARIIRITSSILSEAMIKPSRICARSFALRRSNWVRRITTSCLCSTKYLIISLRFNVLGRPWTNATLFTPKEVCKAVILYSLFSTTLALASRFTSITIRIPSRSDSSFAFEIPSILLSLTRSAIYLISSALLTL